MITTIILTVIAVSIDGMIVGFAYGTGKIKVPIKSLFLISCFPVVMSFCSMIFANFFSENSSEQFINYFCFFAMVILAFFSVRQYYLSKKERKNIKTDISNILIDPSLADFDNTKNIDLKEGFVLGFAIGIDASAGSATLAIIGANIFFTPLLIGVMHFIFIGTGNLLGKKIKRKAEFLRLISAGIFIFLGFMRII